MKTNVSVEFDPNDYKGYAVDPPGSEESEEKESVKKCELNTSALWTVADTSMRRGVCTVKGFCTFQTSVDFGFCSEFLNFRWFPWWL